MGLVNTFFDLFYVSYFDEVYEHSTLVAFLNEDACVWDAFRDFEVFAKGESSRVSVAIEKAFLLIKIDADFVVLIIALNVYDMYHSLCSPFTYNTI